MAKRKDQGEEMELVREMNRVLEQEEQALNSVSSDSTEGSQSSGVLPTDGDADNKKKKGDANKTSQTKATEEEKKKEEELEADEKKKTDEQKAAEAKAKSKAKVRSKLDGMNEVELAQYFLKLCYNPDSLVTGEPGFDSKEAVVRSFYARFNQMDKTAQQFVENRFQYEVQRMSLSQQMYITDSVIKSELYKTESQQQTLLKDTVGFVTTETIGNYDSSSTHFTSLYTINDLMGMGYKKGRYQVRTRDGYVVSVEAKSVGNIRTSSGKGLGLVESTIKKGKETTSVFAYEFGGRPYAAVTVKTDEDELEKAIMEDAEEDYDYEEEEVETKAPPRRTAEASIDPEKVEASGKSMEQINEEMANIPEIDKPLYLVQNGLVKESTFTETVTPPSDELRADIHAHHRNERDNNRTRVVNLLGSKTLTFDEKTLPGLEGTIEVSAAQYYLFVAGMKGLQGQMPKDPEKAKLRIDKFMERFGQQNECDTKPLMALYTAMSSVKGKDALSVIRGFELNRANVQDAKLRIEMLETRIAASRGSSELNAVDAFLGAANSMLDSQNAARTAGAENNNLRVVTKNTANELTTIIGKGTTTSQIVVDNFDKNMDKMLDATQSNNKTYNNYITLKKLDVELIPDSNPQLAKEVEQEKNKEAAKDKKTKEEKPKYENMPHAELTEETQRTLNNDANDLVKEAFKSLENSKASEYEAQEARAREALKKQQQSNSFNNDPQFMRNYNNINNN